MKITDIEKRIGKKIKKSKISEILKYFFYWDIFNKWLETNEQKQSSEIDGNFQKRWQFVLDFEASWIDEKSN